MAVPQSHVGKVPSNHEILRKIGRRCLAALLQAYERSDTVDLLGPGRNAALADSRDSTMSKNEVHPRLVREGIGEGQFSIGRRSG